MKQNEWGKLVVFVTILAIPVTLLSTTPTVFHLKGHLPGGPVGEDAIEHLYMMWWFHYALIELGQNPADLTMLAYPSGYYNPYITVTPFVRLIAVPFIGWADPALFYNMYLFLTFILAWGAMSALCYHLTQDFEASVVGGFVFAFSPHRLIHASGGHITAATVFWFPLLTLGLLDFLRRPTWYKAGLCGILLTISLSIDLNVILYFTAPLVLIILAYHFWKQPHLIQNKRFLYELGLVILIPLLIQGPPFVSFAIDKFRGKLDFLYAEGVELYSSDLLGILVPPPRHPLIRAFDLDWFSVRTVSGAEGSSENVIYIGLFTLFLVFVGLRVRSFPDRKLWLSTSLIAWLLALGPQLKLGGVSTSIPLPYALFTHIPFLEWGRTPSRFGNLMMFGVAILVAYGATVLLRYLSQPKWRLPLMVGLLTLIGLDYVPFLLPWHIARITPPPIYQEIKQSPARLAVLDIPVSNYGVVARSIGYQMVHHHPVVAGRAYRAPHEISAQMQAIEDMAARENAAETLATQHIGYVVLHLDWLDDTRWQSHLTRELGEPIFQDTELVVYALPQSSTEWQP
jgi:hypothetical protein